MAETTTSGSRPIKVGVIADQTGPLSFVGLANANVARMVIGDINAKGGLLGRHVRAVSRGRRDQRRRRRRPAATKLVEQDHVDVIFGGIYSSTRQAIKGPAVVKGRTLYIYPEQYEGQESDPLIFCTGPVPAQQVDPFIPWLMQQTGAKTFYLPSADYIWPHVMNERVREVVTAERRRDRRRGVLPARPHGLQRDGRADHGERRRRRLQHHRAARRRRRSSSSCTMPASPARGGHLVCTYFDENFLNMVPAAHVGGPLQLPRLLPGGQRSVQPEAARAVRHALSRARQVHRRRRVLGPLPRAAAVGGCRDRGRLAARRPM